MKNKQIAGEKKMINIQKNYFHGVDVPLVLKAIKSTGVEISDNVLEAAQDVVADAIMAYDKTKNVQLSSWVYAYIRYQLRNYIQVGYYGKYSRNKNFSPNVVTSLDAPALGKDKNVALHEMLPSDLDVEETALRSVLKDKLDAAINKLDERGQFVVRFFLNANNPMRCGRALGDALAKNGYVEYRGESGNKRSRAQQVLKECFKNLKVFLGHMGVDKDAIDYD